MKDNERLLSDNIRERLLDEVCSEQKGNHPYLKLTSQLLVPGLDKRSSETAILNYIKELEQLEKDAKIYPALRKRKNRGKREGRCRSRYGFKVNGVPSFGMK